MNGTPVEIVLAVAETLAGVWLIAAGVQGYLQFYGVVKGSLVRFALALAGLLIATPGLENVGVDVSNILLASVGVVMGVIALLMSTMIARKAAPVL